MQSCETLCNMKALYRYSCIDHNSTTMGGDVTSKFGSTTPESLASFPPPQLFGCTMCERKVHYGMKWWRGGWKHGKTTYNWCCKFSECSHLLSDPPPECCCSLSNPLSERCSSLSDPVCSHILPVRQSYVSLKCI